MEETRQRIERMQDLTIKFATSTHIEYEDWEDARNDLMSDPKVQRMLPDWLVRCRYAGQFWDFISSEYGTYKERRRFIWDEFGKLLGYVDRHGVNPVSISVDSLLEDFAEWAVDEIWDKCLDRKETDPEGAITSARSLLETVCEHILEELGVDYDAKGDLSRLYKKTAEQLNLSPSQHDEQIFKQILSGCGTVVAGLAGLRNALGDSHGRRRSRPKPGKRHAELAINLAGTLSSFLMHTYQANYKD